MIRLNLLALVAALVIAIAPLLIDTLRTGPSLVNTAGRQRLITESISKDTLALALTMSPSETAFVQEELTRNISAWWTVQNGLRYGDAALGLRSESDPHIIAELDSVTAMGNAMTDAAQRAIALSRDGARDAAELARQVQMASAHGDSVIYVLDDLLGHYVEREERKELYTHIAFAGALLAPLLLSMLAALAYVRQSRALRASWERLRQLAVTIDQAGEGIMITDATGTIEYVNPAYTRITGHARGDLIGRNPRIIRSGRHDPGFYAELWTTLKRGEIWRGRIVDKDKHGRLFQTEQSIAPVRDDTGKTTHYVGIMQDVSQRLQLEQQLARAERLQVVAAMASGIAHDLNNVLTPTMGYAELARLELEQHHPAVPLIEQIRGTVQRAKELVESILRGSPSKGMQQVDVVAKGVLRLLRGSMPPSIGVRLEADPDIPLVEADFNAVHTILLNLCMNAIQAMTQGGMLIVTLDRCYATDANRTLSVRLRVSDTGCGMSEEIRARLFEPFFSTKRAEEGTGLGLYTVKTILDGLGGTIEVESEPGRGSTFTVHLPAEAMGAIGMRIPDGPVNEAEPT